MQDPHFPAPKARAGGFGKAEQQTSREGPYGVVDLDEAISNGEEVFQSMQSALLYAKQALDTSTGGPPRCG